VIVSYLYHTYGINKENDSVQKFTKRFFVFNKLDLSFRELKSNREDNAFVHYHDLKAKQIRDSLEIFRKDNIITVEQNKVIGDVVFGISFEEFQKRKKQFMEKTKNVDWVGSSGHKFYKQNIGDYDFIDVYGGFHNEKLYMVDVEGDLIHYDKYDVEMPRQVEAIQLPYIEKYGEPNIHFEIPKWHTMDKGYTYLVSSWVVGTKKIELRIKPDGSYNRLLVRIFQPKVVEQIKQEKEIKRNEEVKKTKDIL
jgi:hypothetical protein